MSGRHRPGARAVETFETVRGPGTGSGTGSGTARLSARGLVVSYGPTIAVHGARLTVPGGRMLAVTGPSGAGKSSLLGALAGRLPVAHGEVRVDGTTVRDRDHAVQLGVRLIPQGNALVLVFTAAENVALAVGDAHGEVRDVVTAALRDVGLQEAAGQLAEELSGGQQQRAAVARGLAQRGRVLLADEPTSELDSGNRDRVMTLLRAEARRGAAVVVATHDPEAALVCDAELRLVDGVASWVRGGPLADGG